MKARNAFLKSLREIEFLKFFLFDVVIATTIGLISWIITGNEVSSLLVSLVVSNIILVVEIRVQLTRIRDDFMSMIGILRKAIEHEFLSDTISGIVEGYTDLKHIDDTFFIHEAQESIKECRRKISKLQEGEFRVEDKGIFPLLLSLIKQTDHNMFATVFAQTADFWFRHGKGKEILKENVNAVERGVNCTRVFFVEEPSELSEEILNIIEFQLKKGLEVKIAFVQDLTTDLLVDMGLFDEKYVDYIDLVPSTAEMRGGILSRNQAEIQKAKRMRDQILQEANDADDILEQISSENEEE